MNSSTLGFSQLSESLAQIEKKNVTSSVSSKISLRRIQLRKEFRDFEAAIALEEEQCELKRKALQQKKIEQKQKFEIEKQSLFEKLKILERKSYWAHEQQKLNKTFQLKSFRKQEEVFEKSKGKVVDEKLSEEQKCFDFEDVNDEKVDFVEENEIKEEFKQQQENEERVEKEVINKEDCVETERILETIVEVDEFEEDEEDVKEKLVEVLFQDPSFNENEIQETIAPVSSDDGLLENNFEENIGEKLIPDFHFTRVSEENIILLKANEDETERNVNNDEVRILETEELIIVFEDVECFSTEKDNLGHLKEATEKEQSSVLLDVVSIEKEVCNQLRCEDKTDFILEEDKFNNFEDYCVNVIVGLCSKNKDDFRKSENHALGEIEIKYEVQKMFLDKILEEITGQNRSFKFRRKAVEVYF